MTVAVRGGRKDGERGLRAEAPLQSTKVGLSPPSNLHNTEPKKIEIL